MATAIYMLLNQEYIVKTYPQYETIARSYYFTGGAFTLTATFLSMNVFRFQPTHFSVIFPLNYILVILSMASFNCLVVSLSFMLGDPKLLVIPFSYLLGLITLYVLFGELYVNAMYGGDNVGRKHFDNSINENFNWPKKLKFGLIWVVVAVTVGFLIKYYGGSKEFWLEATLIGVWTFIFMLDFSFIFRGNLGNVEK